MGCAESKTIEEKEAKKVNDKLEKDLKERKKELMSEIKLLLLGTGESGKSTIAKQLRILHTSGFTKTELLSFKPILIQNTFSSMKSLLQAAEKNSLQLVEANQDKAKNLLEINAFDLETLSDEMADAIEALWKDPAIQSAYELRNTFHLLDSAQYCFENVKRFAAPDFIPSQEDILRVRATTTGIIETQFVINSSQFRLVDVGGQRSERKKWIHCFEDVTAIIYCVALNEYDMKLFEDEQVNRMQESMELFEEIANSKWFVRTAIILFLNKSDLFREKIKTVDLTVLFPDYEGGKDYDNGVKYIENAFLKLSRAPNKKIFSHVTCATDTENVRVVFEASKEIIITQNLERLGFGQF